MLSLFRTVTFRRLFEHPFRTALTVLGVAMGVAAFVSVRMILSTISDSFASMIDSVSGKTQLQITQGDAGVAESVYERLQTPPGGKPPVDGLAAALPTIQVVTKYQGENVLILAVDVLNDKALRDYKMTDSTGAEISDPLLFLNAKNAVLLSREFAKRHGLVLDQTIELQTSDGRKPFIVRGFLEPTGPAQAFGGSFALMDLFAAQAYFGCAGKFDTIDLLLEPGADVAVVCERVKTFLGGQYDVDRPTQRNAGVDSMLTNIRLGLTIMTYVVLLMGGFIIFNTITTNVYQRMREIGLLRMVGVSRAGIWILFTTESAILGAIGSGLGILGGWALGRWAIVSYLGKVTNVYVPVNATYAAFDTTIALSAGLAGLFVSVFGGMWPSYRATRISPLEVVRFRPGLTLGRISALGRWAAAAAVLLGYLAFALLAPQMNFIWGIQSALLAILLVGVALTPLFMHPFLNLLIRAFSRLKVPLARMAAENVMRDLGRTSMTVAAFMVALAVMFDVYLYMNSTKTELKTWLDEVLNADLLVTSSNTFATRASIPMTNDLTPILTSVPGVKDIIQLRLRFNEWEGSSTLFLSLNFTNHINISRFHFPGPYNLDAVKRWARDEGVFVSRNLVVRHPILRGAKEIVVNTPSGRVALPILAEIIDYTSDTGAVLMNRGLFVKTFQDNLVDTFQLYLNPGADLQGVRARVDAMLGDRFNLFVLTNRDFKGAIMDAIDQLFALGVTLEILTLIIALMGIVNNLLANVIDHTREIGVIRSLGATRAQVAGIYFVQSGILGFCGAFVGCWCGFALAKVNMVRLGALTTGWVMPLHYSVSLIFIVFFFAVVSSVVAGLFPARRAANLALHDALKYE